MNTFLEKAKIILKDPILRKRIGFTLIALFIFRALGSIPIPGIDVVSLQKFLTGNQLFGLFDIFSGGGISHVSIVMLGVGPYITGSIIMQLLTMMSPRLKSLFQEEGEQGRLRLAQYSRMLAVPLALLQSFGFLKLLESQHAIASLSGLSLVTNIIVISAGSILLMWIGELISEFGIGNGVSLIIFAGIVATLPTKALQFIAAFDATQIPFYVLALAIALVVITVVVFVTEAERAVPITYAKQVRGNKVYGGVSTYLPLRLNQAGVIPIIFALSILLFPRVIANFLTSSANGTVAHIATVVSSLLANAWIYNSVYFIFVVLFTYFYTAVTFDPKMIAENLQKGGAFIPGIRPGESTMVYLGKVVTRITLVGALFLGAVAVLPLIMQAATGNTTLAIGGTALLIVVSVVLDLIKKLDAQVSMREY
jgi:preprotein translocase subunit SecY